MANAPVCMQLVEMAFMVSLRLFGLLTRSRSGVPTTLFRERLPSLWVLRWSSGTAARVHARSQRCCRRTLQGTQARLPTQRPCWQRPRGPGGLGDLFLFADLLTWGFRPPFPGRGQCQPFSRLKSTLGTLMTCPLFHSIF